MNINISETTTQNMMVKMAKGHHLLALSGNQQADETAPACLWVTRDLVNFADPCLALTQCIPLKDIYKFTMYHVDIPSLPCLVPNNMSSPWASESSQANPGDHRLQRLVRQSHMANAAVGLQRPPNPQQQRVAGRSTVRIPLERDWFRRGGFHRFGTPTLFG